jgi:hypothetical protein
MNKNFVCKKNEPYGKKSIFENLVNLNFLLKKKKFTTRACGKKQIFFILFRSRVTDDPDGQTDGHHFQTHKLFRISSLGLVLGRYFISGKFF